MSKNASGPKYYRLHATISNSHLAEHLAGSLTLAVVFQNRGRGYLAAADIDAGGAARLRELLDRCRKRGLWAFAIAVRAGKHDGGHLFIPFAQEQDAAALRALAQEIAGDVSHECYPSGADLRLPFGLHQRAQTRGYLLLPDDQAVNLDTDLASGVALLESSWSPNPGTLTSPPRPARPSRPTQKSRDLVPAILDYFDLEDRLEAYSARPAGRGLYYCPFHDDRDPSLVIYQARNGRTACHCMSKNSACPLAEHGRNDVINVVAIGERISITEATEMLAEELRRTQPAPQRSEARPTPRIPAPAPPNEPAPLPHSADELRQAAMLRVMLDTKLLDCAKATYRALDKKAIHYGICAPSVDWLADCAHVHSRTIKRGLRQLEKRGYVQTQRRHGHTSRYTLFWRSDALNDHGVIAGSPNMLVNHGTACEGGHDPAALDFFEPEPIQDSALAVPVTDQATAAAAPSQPEATALVNSVDAIGEEAPPQAGAEEVVPPASPEQAPPYWTRERLQEIKRLRAGPPRPPPAPRSRHKQTRFTRLDGELKQQHAKQPPGPLPEPVASSPPIASSPPAPEPKQARSTGKRRVCPPSQVAPSPNNAWALDADDPWVLLQRYNLARAEAEGNEERAAFFRSVLNRASIKEGG